MPFFHLLSAYLRHWLHVVDEHSIHSPFFFDYYTRVLRGKTDEKKFEKIEELRSNLLANTTAVPIEDMGAGSHTLNEKKRTLADIAKTSKKWKVYGRSGS